MNWDQLQGNWQGLKGKVHEKWGKLTDQDLEWIGGKRDQLIGALKTRYGMEREHAMHEINNWMNTLTDKIAGHEQRDVSSSDATPKPSLKS